MPNPQATPAMVEQIATLEEAVITKDGVVPLTTQTAEPSTPASDGAVTEPAPAPTDTATAPAATPVVEPAPAPTPTLTPDKPAIEVIPGTPPNAAPAATATPAPAAPVEEPVAPTPEAGPTEAERLAGLVSYGESQAEEARRLAQGAADRRASTLQRQVDESKETAKAQSKQIRELQTKDLSDEDRAVVLAKFEQDDEREGLNEFREELVDFHRTVYIDSLSLEFAQYGVTKEDLQAITTPEEMELACERAKSASLGQQLSTNGHTEVAPAATEAAPVVEPYPVPVVPAATAAVEANVPPGATAISDVGSGSAPAETPTFDDGKSDDAMQKNLNNMAWDTVRLPRS